MTELWLNFSIIVLVAFVLYILIALYCRKNIFEIIHILFLGLVTGAVVGILSDLLWGKFLGIWSYSLGYSALPLLINAVLIWGLFSASVLLMQKMNLLNFFVLVMA